MKHVCWYCKDEFEGRFGARFCRDACRKALARGKEPKPAVNPNQPALSGELVYEEPLFDPSLPFFKEPYYNMKRSRPYEDDGIQVNASKQVIEI